MSKFESKIQQVPYTQQSVYNMLSDLSNAERVKQRVDDDQIHSMEFSNDSLSVNVPPIGKIAIQIVDREEPKCVKYKSVDSPLPFNLWVQMLPVTDTTSKMKLTLEAELNFMMKGIVSKPLQEGLEKLAEALASIRYE
ncbi:MAG: SRPBCC family protein [Prevotella sp.]|nr:SRPBCC family protein [Prevotella sp.]MBQ1774005.1 SRPBCC family protein [Prevotella sp.]